MIENPKWDIQILYGVLTSLIFSWIVNYYLGFLHFIFVRRDLPKIEVVEGLSFIAIIPFFACVIVATVMIEEISIAWLWLAVFAISFLLDNLIFDRLAANLSKYKLIGKWTRIRGYFIDIPEDIYPKEKVTDNL